MKTLENFFGKGSVLGLAACLAFSLQSCDQGNRNNETASTEEVEETDALVDDSDIAENEVAGYSYYAVWDVDKDGLLAEEEWNEGWNTHVGEDLDENLYSEWDENDDSSLDETEFTSGFYGYYDENDDSFLDEDEFSGLAKSNYYNAMAGESEGLSEDQINEDWDIYFPRGAYGFNFTQWDADGDGIINEGEFSTNLFGAWDEDDNDLIEESEFQRNYNRRE